jgi:hypothetical protein
MDNIEPRCAGAPLDWAVSFSDGAWWPADPMTVVPSPPSGRHGLACDPTPSDHR